jgi:hypothetical protein
VDLSCRACPPSVRVLVGPANAITVRLVKFLEQVQDPLGRWLFRQQLASKGFANFGPNGPVVEAVREIIGRHDLSSRRVVCGPRPFLEFYCFREVPGSGRTEVISRLAVTHVTGHFKTEFRL